MIALQDLSLLPKNPWTGKRSHSAFEKATSALITAYFELARSDGLDTFHLYDAKRRMSAHELFILQVRLPRMDGLFLYRLNLQQVQFLVKNLEEEEEEEEEMMTKKEKNKNKKKRKEKKKRWTSKNICKRIPLNYAHLTKIHDNTLVDFLPQVSSEDLDE